MSAPLLIEIGTEDLPARYVQPLAQALAQGVVGGLDTRGVAHGDARSFATPRRIAVLVPAVAPRQPEQAVQRKGPALAAAFNDGHATKAAQGFARSCGVDVEALAQEDGYLVYRATRPGRPTGDLLAEIFEDTLKAMDELVPKRMRWGSADDTFVRPVQWLLALLGGDVVPLARFGLSAGRETRGHRFHAPQPVALADASAYEETLNAAYVLGDFAARRALIRDQVEAEAQRLGGQAHVPDELLDEVTALVEWPVAVAGRIEDRFLVLPKEVVICTIEINQRYFPVAAADGSLLPYFVTVANIESSDMAQVIAGNERVVRPRLADALFFWEQDRRQALADHVPGLDRVTFQKDLGSVGDKVRRVTRLAGDIAAALDQDPEPVQRAATLCKADLVTRMVYEFPELQGVMGGYYATACGESEAVARAVAEHYRPAAAGAAIPETATGRILALADKLDTLAGIFAVGLKPGGNKDPYALRRAAIGVLRILGEGELALDLRHWLAQALAAQPAGERGQAVIDALWDFMLERLRALLADRGIAVEVFNAVAATGTTRITDFEARVVAVRGFMQLAEAGSLSAAHKRIRNILRQAAAGEGTEDVDPKRLIEPAECALYDALNRLSAQVEAAAARGEYVDALKTLAQLQPPVDSFFDAVLVMAEDAGVRGNRLALLRHLDRLCRSVADISCLPGS